MGAIGVLCALATPLLTGCGKSDTTTASGKADTPGAAGPVQEKIPPQVQKQAQQRADDLQKMAQQAHNVQAAK